ncbi:MAG TPA: O-antigen ligase family protein [Gaiella sp.]|uniref:O-antigen ligase family protein n=1 Tax=Gaiella sp. TaxID=2663207 RepID=UPI002D807343|nr:O-antigen ligase family protein [Gaiella sp.]HET9287417.1 O-antigen ligase family protein [Gaiella sp.]
MTAEPLPRAHASAGTARALVGDAPAGAIVLAAAVPFLFLHPTYQPSLSVGLGSSTVDATLADAAIACVVVAAALRGRSEGWQPLAGARVVLGLAAAFVLAGAISLATPSLLGEEYDLTTHAISVAKFAWYAALLPATVLLVRSGEDLMPLVRAVVAWSVAATSWGLLQFLGIVSEFEGKRPGQREPSFVGIHDFAALSGAALVVGAIGVALGDGRPAGRRWSWVALATGALGVILSGAMTAVFGLWLAVAALLLAARALGALRARRAVALAAITLLVTAGTAAMRADTIERFAEFLGLRDRVEETGVESYAHRTLLAYIGGRIWLDRPITGVGWQASSEEWAYGPFLEDARERFPDEPDQAFPSPAHPWGIQLLYLQVAADLGIAGIALLLGLAAAAVTAGVRGLRSSPAALVGLGWLCVAAGVWAGIGLVAGLPLGALTWIAIALATVRDPGVVVR